MKRHTISCVVNNGQGVLAKVVGAITAEGINIHSVAVSESEDVDTSRMTLVVEGDEKTGAKIQQHLDELEEVIELEELPEGEYLSRQLMLIKVRAEGEGIARVMQVAELTRATVLEMGDKNMTLELAGDEQQMNAMVRMLRPNGIVELARSGRIAVKRGDE